MLFIIWYEQVKKDGNNKGYGCIDVKLDLNGF